MLHKTKGIILHQIKYTDSGVIVQVYTRDFGRVSIMIKGMRSRNSGKHNVLFQPMFILDLIFYYRELRGGTDAERIYCFIFTCRYLC